MADGNTAVETVFLGLTKIQVSILATVVTVSLIIIPVIASPLSPVPTFFIILFVLIVAVFVNYVIIMKPSE